MAKFSHYNIARPVMKPVQIIRLHPSKYKVFPTNPYVFQFLQLWWFISRRVTWFISRKCILIWTLSRNAKVEIMWSINRTICPEKGYTNVEIHLIRHSCDMASDKASITRVTRDLNNIHIIVASKLLHRYVIEWIGT